MAIVTNLLIAAPVLQDYLVDKDTGTPLAAGIVTFYEDTQRQVLKNWYYQSTNSNPYLFSAGPNPMTLSGVGTFTDAQGNDIIPFFYPYDEDNSNESQPYYITVENSNHELQFTRSNFPFLPSSNQPGNTVPTLENYLINNEFWRNIGSVDITTPESRTDINGVSYYYQTLAPSAHDGFSMPDMIMLKDIAGAVETIDFIKFPPGTQVLDNDITPEYYIDWECTAFQAGQTLKCIQFPLQLHMDVLESETATIIFHAKNNGASTLSQIRVKILQFTGTGTVNSTFVDIKPFTIQNTWQKYTTGSFVLPDADSIAISDTGDDALYVEFAFPETENFNISFTKPQLYLSIEVPTNQWDTYDQIDAVVGTPRTGDIRTSLNSFQPFGWVQMNDGVISNSGTFVLPTGVVAARANQDTWPLFNLIWNSVSDVFAPIYDSAGVASTRTTAIADWNLSKQLQLTKALGRVLLGLPLPVGNITLYNTVSGAFTVDAPFANYIYVGSPIFLTGTALPSAFTADTIYYAIPINLTSFSLATGYDFALTSTAITGGTAGTPPFTANYALGGTFGQSRHVQLPGEVGSHTHTAPLYSLAAGSNALFSNFDTGGAQSSTGTTNANTPASAPFNIIQFSVYYNIFMKL